MARWAIWATSRLSQLARKNTLITLELNRAVLAWLCIHTRFAVTVLERKIQYGKKKVQASTIWCGSALGRLMVG